MRFFPVGPGRVGPPVLDPGDAVALADRNGDPVGEWVTIAPGAVEVVLTVPASCKFRVRSWVARDAAGNVQYWSDVAWLAAGTGSRLHLPLARPHVEAPAASPAAPSPPALPDRPPYVGPPVLPRYPLDGRPRPCPPPPLRPAGQPG